MKFADFYPGQILEAGPYELTEPEVLVFARLYDPQWFHIDPERAAQGPFGGLIASGWQTCGIAMRLAAQRVLEGSESYASPGVQNIKWPAPVRPGDRLSLRAEVISVRTSKSQPHLGILVWRWRMFNQDDVLVLDLEATSMFDLSQNTGA